MPVDKTETMRIKVLCFGELLLRISPESAAGWVDSATIYMAGAEANVAIALAKWGIPVSYFTAVPDHALARQMIAVLKDKGVNTDLIKYQGSRLGLFYLSQGTDMKHGEVIYDRDHSSFSALTKGTINWDLAFQDILWFHFSAISPALNPQVAAVCLEALKVAHEKGIYISVDLNYRDKLWQYGRHPIEVMPELINYCNLIMGNLWAIEKMLGIPVDQDIHTSGEKADYLLSAQKTNAQIFKIFPKCSTVAKTFRLDYQANGVRYFTTLQNRSHPLVASREYLTKEVLDKVGSGDCFMAGLIYGKSKHLGELATLELATAAAFKMLFIAGDSTNSTITELAKFMESYEN